MRWPIVLALFFLLCYGTTALLSFKRKRSVAPYDIDKLLHDAGGLTGEYEVFTADMVFETLERLLGVWRKGRFPPRPTAELIKKHLGVPHFEVEAAEKVGSGAFGEVWRATSSDGRTLVAKFSISVRAQLEHDNKKNQLEHERENKQLRFPIVSKPKSSWSRFLKALEEEDQSLAVLKLSYLNEKIDRARKVLLEEIQIMDYLSSLRAAKYPLVLCYKEFHNRHHPDSKIGCGFDSKFFGQVLLLESYDGSLDQLIKKDSEHGPLSNAEKLVVAHQLAWAMKFLSRTAWLLHLDLKPENIMFNLPVSLDVESGTLVEKEKEKQQVESTSYEEEDRNELEEEHLIGVKLLPSKAVNGGDSETVEPYDGPPLIRDAFSVKSRSFAHHHRGGSSIGTQLPLSLNPLSLNTPSGSVSNLGMSSEGFPAVQQQLYDEDPPSLGSSHSITPSSLGTPRDFSSFPLSVFIGDFGLAHIYQNKSCNSRLYVFETLDDWKNRRKVGRIPRIGTRGYAAPELWEDKKSDLGLFGPVCPPDTVDMYSMGRVFEVAGISSFSPRMREMIDHMTSRSPASRPEWGELVEFLQCLYQLNMRLISGETDEVVDVPESDECEPPSGKVELSVSEVPRTISRSLDRMASDKLLGGEKQVTVGKEKLREADQEAEKTQTQGALTRSAPTASKTKPYGFGKMLKEFFRVK